jgi:hypothetical protein
MAMVTVEQEALFAPLDIGKCLPEIISSNYIHGTTGGWTFASGCDSLFGVLIAWQVEANCRMIVGATQTHRRHCTLTFLLEKRVDRLEENGFNACCCVGQVGNHTQSPGNVHVFIHQIEGSLAICIRARNRESQLGKMRHAISQSYILRL